MRYLFRAGILILIFTGEGCIKDPIHINLFPIKANPGKFECYINGQDYVPDSGGLHLFGGPIITYVDNFNNGTYDIYIGANTLSYANHDGQSVDLSIQNITGTGVYKFNTPEHQEADYYLNPVLGYQNPPPQPLFYQEYTPGHGSLTLTRFDVKNQVIAGTFWFNAVNVHNPSDSVKITSGHFNISYASQ